MQLGPSEINNSQSRLIIIQRISAIKLSLNSKEFTAVGVTAAYFTAIFQSYSV